MLLSVRLITNQKLISSLVQQWDALKRPKPGATTCGGESGRNVVAYLSYPNGRRVTTATQYSECWVATNGDIGGRYDRHLWHELLKLTPATGHTSPCGCKS